MPNRIQVNGTITVLHTRKMLRNAGRLPAALEGVGAVVENSCMRTSARRPAPDLRGNA